MRARPFRGVPADCRWPSRLQPQPVGSGTMCPPGSMQEKTSGYAGGSLFRKPTLNGKNSLDWGFRGQISRFYYSETRLAANASEKTTPKLVWLPTGLSRLLRDSFGCQWDGFRYSETHYAARLPAPRLPETPDVSQVCNLGERRRHGLPVLSVPTGPRTHPFRRCQRDGSKRAQ